ncbi:hypothetical protein PISMIDRAFT_18743 [Pisolithus microcarpus 441]|uniref:Unplaced genomic scaffold scaffold_398, whole genome shotgun sequence n=1 Tax=Pisolithus microcarpus 441 TaxID=765257 RepID=A0A0C9YX45_9AGAM|nr:hypothetical protein PISMIDRAFT_18743 [Pisolithus microcarpus 441]
MHSKTLLHGYLLLALLPIAKFPHKDSRVRSLLQDQLTHQVLSKLLSPLKTAATVSIMMNDPTENLLATTSQKASLVTTATSKQLGNLFHHPVCMATVTLAAIQEAYAKCSPSGYKAFLRVIRGLHLNGVIEPFWKTYPLLDPSELITPEVLHHFHWFFWDHDVKWCITAAGAAEVDFRFSLLQTTIGYRKFADGISKLKQVTGCDHCAVQCYIVGVIAGSVPH